MDVKMTNDNLEGLPNDLIYSIQKIYVPAGLQVTTKALREPESSEYGACRFGLNDYGIAFRVAKTTPTENYPKIHTAAPDAEIILSIVSCEGLYSSKNLSTLYLDNNALMPCRI